MRYFNYNMVILCRCTLDVQYFLSVHTFTIFLTVDHFVVEMTYKGHTRSLKVKHCDKAPMTSYK